jgi:hypothetical protein
MASLESCSVMELRGMSKPMVRAIIEMPSHVAAALLRCFSESTGEQVILIRVRLVRRKVGEDEPLALVWEVEMLPNNGGIYKILLKGGRDEKGVHNNQGQ